MAKHWYRKVNQWDVPWKTRDLARHALQYVDRDLSLGSVTIQWVTPVTEDEARKENMRARIERNPFLSKRDLPCLETHDDAAGWSDFLRDTEMFIRVDLAPEVLVQTVLHEARHLYQAKNYRPPMTVRGVEFAEQDAETYATDHREAVLISIKGGRPWLVR